MPPRSMNPQPETEEEEPQYVSVNDMQRLIDEAIAKRDAAHSVQLAEMQALIPTTTIPAHGAGPGLTVRKSWSLAEQEQSRAGTWEEPETD